MLDEALNMWYDQVQADLWRLDWDSEENTTLSTVSWTELYTISSEFVRNWLVRYAGTPLVRTTRKRVREMDSTPQSGTPYRYYIYQNKLGLYPVPNAVWSVEIEYYKDQAKLSTSQDSELPDVCDKPITIYAAYMLFLPIDAAKAANLLSEYERTMNKVRFKLWYQDENVKFWWRRWWGITRATVLDD